jgi:hypothetical protein
MTATDGFIEGCKYPLPFLKNLIKLNVLQIKQMSTHGSWLVCLTKTLESDATSPRWFCWAFQDRGLAGESAFDWQLG